MTPEERRSLTPAQLKAVDKVPDCVELEDLDDDTWNHVVFRVEHVVDVFQGDGEDFYTKREAKACQRWLKKHAPESEYSKVQL